MFQAEQWIEQIRGAEHGTPRMEIMQNAITEADASAAHYWRIYFRYEYIRESIFHEDNFKAIIMFPELLQVFDDHPEQEDDTFDDVMQAFKWVLENMKDYYQISLQEVEKYYDEYEKRCRKYGFSLRVYYQKKSNFYLPIDKEKAKEAHQQFRSCKRDGNSDCEACETHHDLCLALELEDEAEALRVAAPILDGRKTCAEVPHVSYGALTRFYLYHGNLAEASYYGTLCARYTCSEPEFLAESGYLLELYSATDPAEGWRLFKQNVQNYMECRNPRMRMTFARGAYRLLQCAAKQTEFSNSVFLKPLPVAPSEDGYRFTDLIQYFYTTAKEQCELLDKRNGSSYYTDLLETVLPEADAEHPIEEQSAGSCHGLVRKIPCALAAIPAAATKTALAERLSGLSDSMELLSHSEEEECLYVTLRFEGKIYEASLSWMETEHPFYLRAHDSLDEETFHAMEEARLYLLLQMHYSDDPTASMHVAMHLLYTLLPDMLGVADLISCLTYSSAWVRFAGTLRNAVKIADLFYLNIVAAQDDDEVWMTTQGLAVLGLRELEVIGTNRNNFGYFASILHYTGCQAAEAAMLDDAGKYITSIRFEEDECDITWVKPETILADMPDSYAAQISRSVPSGVLQVITEDGAFCQPTEFPLMAEGAEPDLSASHSEFVRRIFLAKETIPQLKNAYEQLSASVPIEQAGVRVEFSLTPENRQKYGYSKELLWAEIENFEGETIKARIAETSELLPECHEGDEVIVTSENITGWLIRPEGGDTFITEQDACFFM